MTIKPQSCQLLGSNSIPESNKSRGSTVSKSFIMRDIIITIVQANLADEDIAHSWFESNSPITL